MPLETVWEMPDEAWERLERILRERYPAAERGRPRADLRRVCNGIIFRLRSGCQWNRLPKMFGDDSTVHRWFQRWAQDGVLEDLWAELVGACDELGGVQWKWQAADGVMGKSRFAGDKRGATPRTGARPAPRRASLWKATEAPSG